MITITQEKISLLTYDEGLNFETFKTFEDLLKMAVIKRVGELRACGIKNPAVASIMIQKETRQILNEIIEADKDDPEKVCPISGAAFNCYKCSKSEECDADGGT